MSTRGVQGFFIGGKTIAAYNHCDSYPEVLGNQMVEDTLSLLSRYTLDDLKAKVQGLRLVKEDKTPSAADVEALAMFKNPNVSTGEDWYSLLREMQGHIGLYVEAGVIIDSASFLKDSLFCEWAYLINLDDQCFEVYRGFQKSPHKQGRYGTLRKAKGADYFPVALIASIPFAELATRAETPMDEWPEITALYAKEEAE